MTTLAAHPAPSAKQLARWGAPPLRWVSKPSGAPTLCPWCRRYRRHEHYVCADCWEQLPRDARRALSGRHDAAVIPTLRWLASAGDVPAGDATAEVGGRA